MLSIMKNKKLLCSVCFLFTFMSVLWGQNITVKGNVTSKTDGQPIIGASVVQNDSKSTGTITAQSETLGDCVKILIFAS